ncbi:N-acetylmuramic acid 6-phosphate etherase [Candidatus Bathyarchaeota archaeon]|nr:N-acetylmuramic acid 6-phosphate etherase [Candidatus Bathyarchaeota archaeon]MBS7613608.1 N-acetylmuramic acid 6-phosphate etherase [Candidatus Bathyarchaeota archaeon]MBS7618004.1 N-acetylmuramic acid 6-phosphate etherase [Candidatus Bathyarchaeota archaeon]
MDDVEELDRLISEQRNVRSVELDKLDIEDILRLINDEDKKVAYAVEKEIPNIAKAVEACLRSLKDRGRVFYVGAGTSGRLAVIDRAELLSTFNIDPRRVMAILAGGLKAVYGPSEAAEDREENGAKAIAKRRVSKVDTVIGISASGRTPYVIGALKEAKSRGATTVAITVNPDAKISKHADIVICTVVGPEVIAGSTRMKAGTAQKIVLTMLSTTVMVKLGMVYSNLMVSLKPISFKLRERAKRIVMVEASVNYEEASRVLEDTNYDVKASIIMLKTGIRYELAKKSLEEANGNLEKALTVAAGLKNKFKNAG